MISPHRGREIGLVGLGAKPLAYFFHDLRLQTFVFRGLARSLVYRPGGESRAYKFERAHSMHARGLISDASAHARCGLLLGYSKDDIRDFLGRREGLR